MTEVALRARDPRVGFELGQGRRPVRGLGLGGLVAVSGSTGRGRTEAAGRLMAATLSRSTASPA